MKVALDAMGSDSAPMAEIEGAALALEDDSSLKIALVGQPQLLQDSVSSVPDRIELVHADDVVGMHENPAEAIRRKRRSSIAVCMQLLKERKVDAVVSAGNTGAVMAFAVTSIGVIEGVHRPTLGIMFPNVRGSTLVLDVGANVDTKSRQLLQFGIMGSTAAGFLLHKANPTVGLLSIGREETKGNESST
ncbi:MAG TPA: phosphate--acyl-ACP acyltransferase, partial [candidate division WOR-3 bacterium]|nr:phosphate--acyl-ACP acyltransferase [candidate division WOR-3 bacterium]